jgi:hypothetical protein
LLHHLLRLLSKVVLEFPNGTAATWGGPQLDVFYHLGAETAHHGEFTENWNINHYNQVILG